MGPVVDPADPADPADPWRDVEEELAVFFRRTRARAAELAAQLHPDLDADDYGLLATLDRVGPARVTDLARAIGVGKATMSRQVRALEGLGLVRRSPDPDDGRALRLELSDDGRARFRASRELRRARVRELLAEWAEGDVRRFADLLRRFNEDLSGTPA